MVHEMRETSRRDVRVDSLMDLQFVASCPWLSLSFYSSSRISSVVSHISSLIVPRRRHIRPRWSASLAQAVTPHQNKIVLTTLRVRRRKRVHRWSRGYNPVLHNAALEIIALDRELGLALLEVLDGLALGFNFLRGLDLGHFAHEGCAPEGCRVFVDVLPIGKRSSALSTCHE